MGLLAFLASATILQAESTKATPVGSSNPAAPGFLMKDSDPEAIALADRVMLRLGGRAAWDSTRFVTWRFFGNRFHVWDRHTGDIRIEGTDRDSGESYLVLMNLETKTGRAWRNGQEVVETEPLAGLLELGESAWINDSYWMFMPYKLKDTGVALEYLGAGELLDGRPAEVVGLTFQDVGRTPENRYKVYVARDTGLVEQWDFYSKSEDEEPRFQTPWRNWRRHGSILLSDDRGRGLHTDIAVFETLPEEVFTLEDAVDLAEFDRAPTGEPAEAPIHTVEGDVERPVLAESVNPEYTAAAKEARIEGRVRVRTVIGEDGSVRDAWVTQKLDNGLDSAALEAVKAWRFEPATLGGEAVPVYYNLTINFELDGEESER